MNLPYINIYPDVFEKNFYRSISVYFNNNISNSFDILDKEIISFLQKYIHFVDDNINSDNILSTKLNNYLKFYNSMNKIIKQIIENLIKLNFISFRIYFSISTESNYINIDANLNKIFYRDGYKDNLVPEYLFLRMSIFLTPNPSICLENDITILNIKNISARWILDWFNTNSLSYIETDIFIFKLIKPSHTKFCINESVINNIIYKISNHSLFPFRLEENYNKVKKYVIKVKGN